MRGHFSLRVQLSKIIFSEGGFRFMSTKHSSTNQIAGINRFNVFCITLNSKDSVLPVSKHREES